MKSSQSSTGFEQNNCDVTRIPGYVIKKNSSRGAKHGSSERQIMYYQAKHMLKKARQKKHGRHPTNDNDGMLVYFSVTLHDDDTQDFDTRWDEVPL